MNQENKMLLRWKKIEDGACLLQVLGDTAVIKIPDEVEGNPITEIGAYCFSVREQKLNGAEPIFETFCGEEATLCPLEGNEVEEILLPKGLKRIGNAAFYNCRKLRKITVGGQVRNIGSDVFVNCSQLKQICFRAALKEVNGMQQFLNRISSEIELFFLTEENQIEAALLYTEYYEMLDEIAPAHIFGRNIVGEGFRARQQFKDEIVQLEDYDSVFERLSFEEDVKSAGKMALNRLRYPIDLTEQKKQQYIAFIVGQNDSIVSNLILEKKKEELEYLCSKKYITESVLEQGMKQAVQMEWSEGAACFLEWKKKYYGACRKSRYDF